MALVKPPRPATAEVEPDAAPAAANLEPVTAPAGATVEPDALGFGYFDPAYFDPAYFDTGSVSVGTKPDPPARVALG